MNATVTHRMMGPDEETTPNRIGQRLRMFLMKHLGEDLRKAILRPNCGKGSVCTLRRTGLTK